MIIKKQVNVNDLDNDELFNNLKHSMGITYNDNVTISPEIFPNYTEKVNESYI